MKIKFGLLEMLPADVPSLCPIAYYSGDFKKSKDFFIRKAINQLYFSFIPSRFLLTFDSDKNTTSNNKRHLAF